VRRKANHQNCDAFPLPYLDFHDQSTKLVPWKLSGFRYTYLLDPHSFSVCPRHCSFTVPTGAGTIVSHGIETSAVFWRDDATHSSRFLVLVFLVPGFWFLFSLAHFHLRLWAGQLFALYGSCGVPSAIVMTLFLNQRVSTGRCRQCPVTDVWPSPATTPGLLVMLSAKLQSGGETTLQQLVLHNKSC
jgi:hypothetical protein